MNKRQKKSRKQIVRRRRKILGIVSSTFLLVGFAIMLGTAGASDCNIIPFWRIVVQSLIGLAIFASGFLGYWLLDSTR